MCEPSLFYFGKQLHEGPPSKSCYKPLKDFLSGSARSFSILAILTGSTALLQFCLHLCMLNRPLPPQNPQNSQAPSDEEKQTKGAKNGWSGGHKTKHQ